MSKSSVYFGFLVLLATVEVALCSGFMRGVDITAQGRQDQDGVVYKEYGIQKDILEILKNHDINWVRLRVFHTPTGATYGVEDLDYVTQLAVRVKQAGFKLLLDFHYSDTWADPGHQDIPATWLGMSHSELVTAVYEYSRDVIVHLRTNGAMPEMVQIGNEIICGMLWPDGNVCNSGSWPNLAELVDAGIDGVRDGRGSEAMPEIMIHLDRGGNWNSTEWFFDNLIAQGIEFDVIGQSFYPEWHGTLDDLSNNLENMANKYSQDIIIVEVGEYYTGTEGKSPEGQKVFLEQVISRVENTANGKGRGVCYWEPTWVWNSGVGWRALFKPDPTWDNVDMLMAMEAFDIETCSEVWQGGYGLTGDVNRDCYVNLDDLRIMALYWLYNDCWNYNNCGNSDLEVVDGTVDLGDFGNFSIDWGRCNEPSDENCESNWLN